MEYQLIFVLLIIGHFLGDFYFQSAAMVRRKNRNTLVMLGHGCIYLASVLAPFLLLFAAPLTGWYLIFIVTLLHIIMDIVKALWLKGKPFFKKNPLRLFVIDQSVHLLVIALVAYFYAIDTVVAYSNATLRLGEIYASLQLGLGPWDLLCLTSLFLFLGKPANIFIRYICGHGDEFEQGATPSQQQTGWVLVRKISKIEDLARRVEPAAEADQQAGRIIGVLERYLTVILILLGQYAAVGLAFTAKSVTRFNKIANEPDFAEQYLIGTMSSLLLAVIGAVLYNFVH